MIAESFLKIQAQHLIQNDTTQKRFNTALSTEGKTIFDGIMNLELPIELHEAREKTEKQLDSQFDVNDGPYQVLFRWVSLAALRAPLDNAIASSEDPKRRLIDRAFLHLNRTLSIDVDTRQKWKHAFQAETKGHETKCEQLGALHLLSHGIYAFKAHANTGETDLIVSESPPPPTSTKIDLILERPIELTPEVQAAEAMVLTEWKLVRPGDQVERKAASGTYQAQRYARVELAGFELRRHSYVVLVSLLPIHEPKPQLIGGIMYHYVNIVIDKVTPSDEGEMKAKSNARREPMVSIQDVSDD